MKTICLSDGDAFSLYAMPGMDSCVLSFSLAWGMYLTNPLSQSRLVTYLYIYECVPHIESIDSQITEYQNHLLMDTRFFIKTRDVAVGLTAYL